MEGNAQNTSANYVNLQIYGTDCSMVEMKILKTTALRHLMDAYCKNANIRKDSVKFLFDGQVLYDEDTANSLELDDQDVIEIFKNSSFKHVKGKILGTDHSTVDFEIKIQCPMKNLMATYCKTFGIQKVSINFVYNGRVISNNDTPTSMGLINDGTIQISQKPISSIITPDHVTLKILGKRNVMSKCIAKKHVPLKKLKDLFQNKYRLKNNPTLIFKRKIIKDEDTPTSLKLKDNDCIKISFYC